MQSRSRRGGVRGYHPLLQELSNAINELSWFYPSRHLFLAFATYGHLTRRDASFVMHSLIATNMNKDSENKEGGGGGEQKWWTSFSG